MGGGQFGVFRAQFTETADFKTRSYVSRFSLRSAFPRVADLPC